MSDEGQPRQDAIAKVEPGTVHVQGEQVTTRVDATATVSLKQTWRDWRRAEGVDASDIDIEAKPYLTRGEVLAAAHELGVPMTERMLRGWEYAGALPRPERRWHEEHRSVQTVYPAWMPQLIRLAYGIHSKEAIAVSDLGPLVTQQINMAVILTHLGGEDIGEIAEARSPGIEAMLIKLLRQFRRDGHKAMTWKVTTTITTTGQAEDDSLIEPVVHEYALTLRGN